LQLAQLVAALVLALALLLWVGRWRAMRHAKGHDTAVASQLVQVVQSN
jgi:hypothetical protein